MYLFLDSSQAFIKRFDELETTMADFNEGKNEKPTDENSVRQVYDWLPDDCEALADGGRQSAIYNQREAWHVSRLSILSTWNQLEYDAIIMGTGLTECIISGLLSVKGFLILLSFPTRINSI